MPPLSLSLLADFTAFSAINVGNFNGMYFVVVTQDLHLLCLRIHYWEGDIIILT
jgi:hypothetical protein